MMILISIRAFPTVSEWDTNKSLIKLIFSCQLFYSICRVSLLFNVFFFWRRKIAFGQSKMEKIYLKFPFFKLMKIDFNMGKKKLALTTDKISQPQRFKRFLFKLESKQNKLFVCFLYFLSFGVLWISLNVPRHVLERWLLVVSGLIRWKVIFPRAIREAWHRHPKHRTPCHTAVVLEPLAQCNEGSRLFLLKDSWWKEMQ